MDFLVQILLGVLVGLSAPVVLLFVVLFVAVVWVFVGGFLGSEPVTNRCLNSRPNVFALPHNTGYGLKNVIKQLYEEATR